MKLAAILALLPALAVACSIAFTEDFTKLEMRPSFVVTITHRGQPLAGATVEVYRSSSDTVLLTTTTGSDGSVRIEKLRQGNYWVDAAYMGRSAVWREMFHVARRPTPKAVGSLSYTWGEQAHLVRSAPGVFLNRAPGKDFRETYLNPTWVPEPAVRVTLENAITRERFATVAASDGVFDFGVIPPGTYLLRAEKPVTPQLPVDLLIVLAPNAERQTLRVQLNAAMCGAPFVE